MGNPNMNKITNSERDDVQTDVEGAGAEGGDLDSAFRRCMKLTPLNKSKSLSTPQGVSKRMNVPMKE